MSPSVDKKSTVISEPRHSCFRHLSMNSRSHCSARSRSDEGPSGSTNTVESVFAQGALHPIAQTIKSWLIRAPSFSGGRLTRAWDGSLNGTSASLSMTVGFYQPSCGLIWIVVLNEMPLMLGIVYVTAEMWMMISKAKLFKDEVSKQRIRVRPQGIILI
jgi:hypothetical protein